MSPALLNPILQTHYRLKQLFAEECELTAESSTSLRECVLMFAIYNVERPPSAL